MANSHDNSSLESKVTDLSVDKSENTKNIKKSRLLKNITGGELMAEFLIDWNVPYVFGLGGSDEVGFLDALVDKLPLQYIQALHEGSVMAMADGYARVTDQPSFVNLHTIGGASYALGPMVNAFKDRIPMVVTVGRQDSRLRGSNAFLESVSLQQIPGEFCRWTWDVLAAETIPAVLRRAFILAQTPPCGPAFITVSKNLWEQPVAEAEILPSSRSKPGLNLRPTEDDIEKAVDMLLDADFPVLFTGRELQRFGGTDELMRIAEILGAPVFDDLPDALSPIMVPNTHSHSVGFYSEDPSFYKQSDLFWCIGGTMFTQFSIQPELLVPRSAKIIHTSLDASAIGRNYPVDLAMTANVQIALSLVLEELLKRNLPKTAIEKRRALVEDYHHNRCAGFKKQAEKVWNDQTIAGERLMIELNHCLDPDAIIVSELITSESLLQAYLDIDHRIENRRLNLNSGGGVLGWGVAAAIGAKMGQPNRQTVALVGDGSFQFGVQALWSAARYEVPIGIVVWNNGGYQANRSALHRYGGKAVETGKYIGSSLLSPEIDTVSIAKGYGVEGETVTDPSKLKPALHRCLRVLEEGRPYLLDVKIQKRRGGADSSWCDHFSFARDVLRKI